VRCIESERNFSLTGGLWRREIYVSSAMANALPPRLLEAVIAHERAHARRRDGLRMLAARVLSWPQLPRVRRSILAELDLATELACDEQAGSRLSDRLVVAEAILAAERLLASTSWRAPGPLLAFGGSSVPARVQSLLAAPPTQGTLPGRWMVGLLLLASWLLADPLHHATEHLLGFWVGTR
jgi:beta-lactamase regulating signal transducer with metallopeptidase domain